MIPLLPFYVSSIAAGFPSPAEDEIAEALDLNALVIKRPAATFFLRVSGSSMINAGIHDGDIVVVDRSLKPKDGKIVIAVLNGELTVKRLKLKGKKMQLVAENPSFAPIEVSEYADFRVWGVVTFVIHAV